MRKMKLPTSRKALHVYKQAHPACQVWFVCKGILICTRDASNLQTLSAPSFRGTALQDRSQSLKESTKGMHGLDLERRAISLSLNSQRMSTYSPNSSFSLSSEAYSRSSSRRSLMSSDSFSVHIDPLSVTDVVEEEPSNFLKVYETGDCLGPANLSKEFSQPMNEKALEEQWVMEKGQLEKPLKEKEDILGDKKLPSQDDQPRNNKKAFEEQLVTEKSKLEKPLKEKEDTVGDKMSPSHDNKPMSIKALKEQLDTEKCQLEKLLKEKEDIISVKRSPSQDDQPMNKEISEEQLVTGNSQLEKSVKGVTDLIDDKKLPSQVNQPMSMKALKEQLVTEKSQLEKPLEEKKYIIDYTTLPPKDSQPINKKAFEEHLVTEKYQLEQKEGMVVKNLTELDKHEVNFSLSARHDAHSYEQSLGIKSLRKQAVVERPELEKMLKDKEDTIVKMSIKMAGDEACISDLCLNIKSLEERVRGLSIEKVKLEAMYAASEKFLDETRKILQEAQSSLETVQRERVQLRGSAEFSYGELREATHDFDPTLKLGEGGFGAVYKGTLRYTTVAIKRMSSEGTSGADGFQQEIDVLTKIRHPNLVTLIGACSEKHCLVYEFMPNGSLEDRLLCKDGRAPLWWQVRCRIAAGICRGLLFLYSASPPVVHGDMKPANILLDANDSVKISDFGICRFLPMQGDVTGTICKRTDPMGTLAYIDPQFLQHGELTLKSDVYAFGVILLELLTGKSGVGLINQVQEAVSDRRLQSILDPEAGNWPFSVASQLANLGLRCCEFNRRCRPDLSTEIWPLLQLYL